MKDGLPLVVSYGAGVDSTAMLVGMAARGVAVDMILFANTGSEKPETYDYLHKVMQPWLAARGLPAVEVVKYVPKKSRHGVYHSLEQECLVAGTLPSLAFGYKKCSLKWKRGPMDARVRTWAPALEAWRRGQKVIRAIGYDAGKADMKRGWKLKDDARHSYWYPLRQWGWDRERCEAEILAAGLPLPMKSACFFCPASKPRELDWLAAEHPELAGRIVEMERVAKPNLRKIEGLWGQGCKGTRGAEARPGSMTVYLRRLPILPG